MMAKSEAKLTIAAATAEAAQNFPDTRALNAAPFSSLPRIGFDIGPVLSSLGRDDDSMHLSNEVVQLLHFVQLLAGDDNMFFISFMGKAQQQQALLLMQKYPRLMSCFPSTRRFFKDSSTPETWMLQVCRKLSIDLMLGDHLGVCEVLRNAGIRCFCPVFSESEKKCNLPDNFGSWQDAVRGLLCELLETRHRLGIPDQPFNVFPGGGQRIKRTVVSEVIPQKRSRTEAELPVSLEDSLEGWGVLKRSSSAGTTEQVQNEEERCKGRHMHQPTHGKLMTFPEWCDKCRLLAKEVGCISCVTRWDSDQRRFGKAYAKLR